MEKLAEEIRWFLKSTGHKGFPYLRCYLRVSIAEALKSHSKEEVESAIEREIDAVARELNIDAWLT